MHEHAIKRAALGCRQCPVWKRSVSDITFFYRDEISFDCNWDVIGVMYGYYTGFTIPVVILVERHSDRLVLHAIIVKYVRLHSYFKKIIKLQNKIQRTRIKWLNGRVKLFTNKHVL
jgi:hypothetical protein